MLSSSSGWLAAQRPPAPVRVEAVRREAVQELRQVPGDVRARQRAAVATREAGLVLELTAREGERVKRGAPIAQLDATRLELDARVLEAERSVAQATVVERESDLDQAERDLATLRDLAQRSAANPKEVADAATRLAGVRSRVQQARLGIATLDARLALLRQRVADMRIVAPFDGVVTARRTEQGQWLGAGETVVELVSESALEGWIEVPQRYFASLAEGATELRVRADAADAEFLAQGLRVVSVVDPRSRSFSVVVDVPADVKLLPGMSLSAWVPTGLEVEHLTVAADALLRNSTGAYVYVAAPGAPGPEGAPGGSQAQMVPIDVLFRVGERAVVRPGGLAEGALAIVEGNERLYPTAPVAPVDAASGDAVEAGAAEAAGDAEKASGQASAEGAQR